MSGGGSGSNGAHPPPPNGARDCVFVSAHGRELTWSSLTGGDAWGVLQQALGLLAELDAESAASDHRWLWSRLSSCDFLPVVCSSASSKCCWISATGSFVT